MSKIKGYIGIWIGTWNSKPAMINSGHNMCNVWVYDGEWKQIIKAMHVLELSEIVGQGSVWDWPVDMISEAADETG